MGGWWDIVKDARHAVRWAINLVIGNGWGSSPPNSGAGSENHDKAKGRQPLINIGFLATLTTALFQELLDAHSSQLMFYCCQGVQHFPYFSTRLFIPWFYSSVTYIDTNAPSGLTFCNFPYPRH